VTGLSAGAAPGATGGLVLTLNADLSLEVAVAGGPRIRTSGTASPIAPGEYQVVFHNDVPDAQDGYHMFRLVGPSVSIFTDLLAGDDRAELHTVTLQPASMYVFDDDRHPQFGRVVFSTAATGTASGVASGGASGGSSSGSSGGTAKNATVVGSNVVVTRGTLAGGVSTSGKLTLARSGKAVSSLKSGRYKLVVLDESGRSGFFLQKLGRAAVRLTSGSFVGRHTVTVTLKPGQWMFYAAGGRKSYFVVTA
jgi:hypothetical protein